MTGFCTPHLLPLLFGLSLPQTSPSCNIEHRITSIVGSGLSTSYTYNGLDTRVSKSGTGGARTYKRDGANVTAPVLSDTVATTVPGISERSSGATRTLHHDRLGTTGLQTGPSQAVTNTRTFDAFGLPISTTNPNASQKGYAGAFGYQEDDESGLKLLGHRYYDAGSGRFLTRDPIGDGNNWYAYCENNPLKKVDPTGLDSLYFDGLLLWYYDDAGLLLGVYFAMSGMPGTSSRDQTAMGGPIPEGEYYIDANEAQWSSSNPFQLGPGSPYFPSWTWSSWGNAKIPIHAKPGTKTFGRSGFFLHGGEFIGSRGCIDIGPCDSYPIGMIHHRNKGRKVKLTVKYGKGYGKVPPKGTKWPRLPKVAPKKFPIHRSLV
jgi:RHS repeat-associated protein